MKIILTLSFLCTLVFAKSQTAPQEEHKEYSNSLFRIVYPASWQIDDSKKLGAELFVFSPIEGPSDTFRENVNVLIQDLTGQNIDLAKYKKITDDQLKDLGAAVKVYESVVEKSKSGKYYRISYEMTQGLNHMRVQSKCFIKNEKAYLVTFTAAFDQYEKYAAAGTAMVNSFSLVE